VEENMFTDAQLMETEPMSNKNRLKETRESLLMSKAELGDQTQASPGARAKTNRKKQNF
jgi:hypothetical protein